MKIERFNSTPIARIPFLNAGRRPNQFYKDSVSVFHARSQLPSNLDAIIVTADLQGRETFPNHKFGPAQGLRLLGEVLPDHLFPILHNLDVHANQRIGAILAGDFYTYPDLRGRGGTGDVTSVWQSIANEYRWVVGVAGNHDTFGKRGQTFSQSNAHFLDGHRVDVDGLRIAGLSGVIGSPRKNFRRNHADYINELDDLLSQPTDIALMHEGPNAPHERGCRGIDDIREVIAMRSPKLVIRGHCHWPKPFVEYPSGVQVLNVDATVVIITN